MHEKDDDNFTHDYWERQHKENRTGWDVGSISLPLKEYFDQIKNKDQKILIPGAGSGWEAEYLFNNGFKDVFILDISRYAIEKFKKRVPGFPKNQILNQDFFQHYGQYDLIIEQTFFSAITINKRQLFTEQILNILKPGGKWVGLLFNHEFIENEPPFGATYQEYKNLFFDKFIVKTFSIADNSIKPRKGREFFFILQKFC